MSTTTTITTSDRFRIMFFKSDEAVAAFQEIGMQYEDTMWDKDYALFLQKTRKTPEKDRVKQIGILKRLVLTTSKGDEQWIVHDIREEALDALGNRVRAYRSGLGCYHSPVGRWVIAVNSETGEKERTLAGVDSLETKYSIPFTKENISKLEKYVTPKTAFTIQKDDAGRRIKIDTFDDWRWMEDPDAVGYLMRFGHRPSDYEKRVYADEKQGKYQQYVPPQNPGAHIS